MDLFQTTLAALSKKLHGASLYKKDIATTVSALLHVSISEDAISIKNKKIYIHVSPTIKTALLLKKSAILKELEKYDITFMG